MAPVGDMRLQNVSLLRWGFLCRACGLWREPWWTKKGARRAAVAHWHDKHDAGAIVDREWSA